MSAGNDKRVSVWTFVPPHDSDCDVFEEELAKWISAVVERDIGSDLVTELQSGEVLCELFNRLCPEVKLGNYRKFASLDLWKRDNIQIFANATIKYGVPKSAKMNYTFFESKDVICRSPSFLIGCLHHHQSACVCEGSP